MRGFETGSVVGLLLGSAMVLLSACASLTGTSNLLLEDVSKVAGSKVEIGYFTPADSPPGYYVQLGKSGGPVWKIERVYALPIHVPVGSERLYVVHKANGTFSVTPAFEKAPFRGGTNHFECDKKRLPSASGYTPCASVFTKNFWFGDGWGGFLKDIDREAIAEALQQASVIDVVARRPPPEPAPDESAINLRPSQAPSSSMTLDDSRSTPAPSTKKDTPLESSERDDEGRPILRGPIIANRGVFEGVHIVSTTVGVFANGPYPVTIRHSIITAPVCVQAPGHLGLYLEDNTLDCKLGVRFTGTVLMDNIFLGNRIRGQMSNRPDAF
jgi:hypothetical protein